MFGLPDAKRVRRSDLYAPSRSSSSPEPERERETKTDPNLRSVLHSRLTALYGPIPTPFAPKDPPPPTLTIQDTAQDAAPEQEEEQAFEFRLFSTPLATSAPQKIVLRPEEDDTSHDGFVRREREKSFYIAQPATGEQKERYKCAAVSGDQVLELAGKRAWGLEVPWRVVTLRVPSTSGAKRVKGQIHAVDKEGEEKGTRKKAGKKRRMILRERRRKREGMEEAKKRERESKEEAEREKRTRRNREKKVKRKMKEKAKKAGGDEDGSD